jgi:hydroxyacylglutathione hydrolase
MEATAAGTDVERALRDYFAALSAHDAGAPLRMYAPDARAEIHGTLPETDRHGLAAFFAELFAAMPDVTFDIVSLTAQDDRAVVQWHARGTFAGPGTFQGLEPTGARIDLLGADVFVLRDGLIVRTDAYTDGMGLARQLGLLPPAGSAPERGMTKAFNAKTRIGRRLAPSDLEPVADGVWRLQGQPARCNVYLLREDDGEGVVMFDAGARTMTNAVAAAAAQLGGLRRIVLGHGHTDHRGTAPAFDVPVLCHPDEVVDAEGSGGFRYWPEKLHSLATPHRQAHRLLHRFAWDGGPVSIAGTVTEGDGVAQGFQVIALPGHAPGQIGLWRAEDRTALTSDAFYTLDIWGRDSEPHLPFDAYNYDTEQARDSLRKLAALDPAAAWPGHAKPVTGDVRSQLERAAAA